MSLIVISCGGTGGHLSPGIALAEGLIEAGDACKLIISRKDVDSRLIENYPELDYMKLSGGAFSWNPIKFVKFNILQLNGFIQALSLLRKQKPDAVIGFGGFLTGSVVLAGFILGIPIILHEANRRPGKATRLLSGFAQRIYLPEGIRLKGISSQVMRYCGFPIRQSIQKINREEALEKLGFDPTARLLVVLGGSQGAVKLNDWVSEHFEKLAEENINVYCVTGLKNDPKNVIEHETHSGNQVKAIFNSFCDDMANLLSGADLVVSRAGAGSLAEFIRCRVPALLVPYPFAADDHQKANAVFHEQQGAGVVVEQENIDILAEEVIDTIYNDWLLNKFRRNLERLDRYNSIEIMVKDVDRLAAEHHASKS